MALTVDCAYPGGNILVDRIDGTTLYVHQDQRDTTEWWFWWNMRVTGAAGKTLRVEFTGYDGSPGPVGPHGPVMKPGDGPWRWAECPFSEREFTVEVPADADEVRFAFSFPYVKGDLDRFIDGVADDPRVTIDDTFAVSRGGRSSPRIVLGDAAAASRHLLFTCRHHCCEAMASYVLEGVMEELLDNGTLLDTTAVHVVPMVDIDGVEQGDQGKLRAPHDHNRDYSSAPRYPTVAAVEELVCDLSSRGLVLAIDYHCPWIRNGNNESAFFVEPREPHAAPMHRLDQILRRTDTGPVSYTGAFTQRFGVGWNSGEGENFCRFLHEHGGADLQTAFTLEYSYSLTEGAVVTPDNSRTFGRGFAGAVTAFLAETPDR